jgi:hypothetical protein
VVEVDGDDASDVEPAGGRVLAGRVPYVRSWGEARRAADLLRGELRAWGLDGRVVARPNVTCAGVAVVELGWVTPEVARLLAALLAQARTEAGACGKTADAA